MTAGLLVEGRSPPLLCSARSAGGSWRCERLDGKKKVGDLLGQTERLLPGRPKSVAAFVTRFVSSPPAAHAAVVDASKRPVFDTAVGGSAAGVADGPARRKPRRIPRNPVRRRSVALPPSIFRSSSLPLRRLDPQEGPRVGCGPASICRISSRTAAVAHSSWTASTAAVGSSVRMRQ